MKNWISYDFNFSPFEGKQIFTHDQVFCGFPFHSAYKKNPFMYFFHFILFFFLNRDFPPAPNSRFQRNASLAKSHKSIRSTSDHLFEQRVGGKVGDFVCVCTPPHFPFQNWSPREKVMVENKTRRTVCKATFSRREWDKVGVGAFFAWTKA